MTASDTPLTSDFGGRERYNQGADRGEVGAPPRPLDTPTTSVQEVPGMTRAQDTKISTLSDGQDERREEIAARLYGVTERSNYVEFGDLADNERAVHLLMADQVVQLLVEELMDLADELSDSDGCQDPIVDRIGELDGEYALARWEAGE